MKNIIRIVVFLVVSFNVFLNWQLKEVKKRQMDSERLAHYYKSLSKSIKLNLNFSFEYQNFQLPNLLVKDVNGKEFTFKSLVNNRCIIVRFSEFSCGECVDSTICLVNKGLLNNCIILGEYRNVNDLGSFFRQTIPEYPIYNCPGQILPFDTLKIPYLFVVDSNLVLNSFFIPLKEDMNEIEKYLNIVSNEL